MKRPRPEPRHLIVTQSVRITPNMRRISLGGDGLNDFPPNSSGGYVKLRLPTVEGEKPIVRTYTIRNQSEESIDIDFALHGVVMEESGPATRWALDALVGDEILLGGPGAAKPLPEGSGPFLLVGDMTALPAISVNLEDLAENTIGNAIILIRDEADKQNLIKPTGVRVEWLVEKDLGTNPDLLVDAVRNVPADGLAYAWVACEFEAMKRLRQYLRVEKKFGKDRLYISSYWKRGVIEDDHKQVKRADAETIARKGDIAN